jgi:N4-gp56 family major capsid protein
MSKTIIGLNDSKAVKRFSGALAVDTARKSYFNKKFMGVGETASMPIQLLTNLESDAGEQITYDLSMQLRMQPVEGDSVLEGQEEDLKFFTDNVFIDQQRGGVNAGGRMTRKRTLYDLRQIAKRRQSEWWARNFDELFFMYLSGARGMNADMIYPLSYTGFANNALSAPDDPDHILRTAFGGGTIPATKALVDATCIMKLSTIDRLVAKANMMGGGVQGTPQIQPIMVDGEEHFVLVMSPWDEFNLRTTTSTGQWLDIQKAAAAKIGLTSPIFKGGLGMYNNVVLHSHKSIIRFNDYGAGANVLASRSLFLGEQAAVCAFGSPGTGVRFDWHEETRDNGNQIVVSTNSIFGIKKCTFNSKDYGSIAVDSAAADPG